MVTNVSIRKIFPFLEDLMKKLASFALVSFATSLSASSNAQTDTSFKYVNALVNKYSSSIGCTQERLNPRLVSRFADKVNGLEGLYVAAIATDIHCAGGSGTGAFRLVLMGKAKMRATEDSDPDLDYLRVYPELSEPTAIVNGAPRLLTSLYMKEGQLQATGLEYGEQDANCCPSIRTIYKVTLSKREITLEKDDLRSLYTWNFVKVKTF